MAPPDRPPAAPVAAGEERIVLRPLDVVVEWPEPVPAATDASRRERVERARSLGLLGMGSARPRVPIELWGQELELDPDPIMCRNLLRAAFVADGRKGTDAVHEAVGRRMVDMQRRLGGPPLLPGAHVFGGRGGIVGVPTAIPDLNGTGAAIAHLDAVQKTLFTAQTALDGEIRAAQLEIEGEARVILQSRLETALAQALAERAAYGLSAEELPTGEVDREPLVVYSVADTPATRQLRAALDRLAAVRRERLEPAIRAERVADGVGWFVGFTALVALLRGAEPAQILDDPHLRMAYGEDVDTTTRRLQVFSEYAALRASLARANPVLHRIAEAVSGGDDPRLPEQVAGALDTVVRSIGEVRNYSERGGVDGHPALFRTVWSYPAVIEAALAARGEDGRNDSLAGAAAHDLLARIDADKAVIGVSLALAELAISVAGGPIVAGVIAAAHVVARLGEYSTARADFNSALSPLEALDGTDPSAAELFADILLEIVTAVP